METNLISQLREIRSNLLDASQSVSALENKFLGPRPKDGGCDVNPNPPQCDSVGNLLTGIRALSASLAKNLICHHDVIGDFNQEQVAGNPSLAGSGTKARYA